MIITKLLNNQLSSLLPSIISPQQSGFIPGHLIRDNVSLAQELLHILDDKVRVSNTMLKLDMAKAYDHIDWVFIYSVLKAFSFGQI